ncbi:probable UDP-sugar transporter protein SLC35A4 [Corticium candelabrum]|uniref:probable UDP-sugar transporter protein SLC35A4 n=1 Tax=Corticium candelabrum TaxID=121492 RepID=UPI002E26A6F3|nr:probable UDP-sugar transporter protein SLC35A4 [Corticium candelabrum]
MSQDKISSLPDNLTSTADDEVVIIDLENEEQPATEETTDEPEETSAVAKEETSIAKAIAGADLMSHQTASLTFRLFICLIFILITSIYPLLMALTKDNGKFVYHPSAAVLLQELMKFTISVIMCVAVGAKLDGLNGRSIAILSVPSILYMLGNNLSYLALEYASPVSVNVLGNLRLLMVAIVYRLILARPISLVRWVAMGGLLIAVIFSQLRNDLKFAVTMLGLVVILVKSLLSVGTGVYTELVLKHHVSNFHVQNLQMYGWGVVANLGLFLYNNDKPLAHVANTFLEGFTSLVWFTVILAAINGIFIAAVMKHLDNIAKFFCTAIANVLLGIGTAYLMPSEFQFTVLFLISAIMIGFCSYIYSVNRIPSFMYGRIHFYRFDAGN